MVIVNEMLEGDGRNSHMSYGNEVSNVADNGIWIRNDPLK